MTEKNPPGTVIDALRAMVDRSERLQRSARGSASEAATRLTRCELIDLIIGARKQRRRHFDASLFGEPGWDILLDLYVSHCRDQVVDVTGACLASGVAQTTALRYLTELTRSGLVVRTADQNDNRRKLLVISDEGLEKVEAYLDGYSQWVISLHKEKPSDQLQPMQ